MRIAYLTHSLVSCWNHGNAHFQRGLLAALAALGHDATAWEPAEGWSRANLRAAAPDAEARFARMFPKLQSRTYADAIALEAAVAEADLVIVHEWNDPPLVAAAGRWRDRYGFTLLFHDTHHRAVSDPDAIRRFDLERYDGVLAFGEALAAVYRRWGWGNRVFVWHEAADTRRFCPPRSPVPRHGAVWIGNWGDDERADELETFLLEPAAATATPLDIHGVRYPPPALARLAAHGARYRGWIANADVPALFASHAFTVHVPRRFYAAQLPGIPTIRVFEALACGIPLLSAPWEDSEWLFRCGEDFLMARTGAEMAAMMRAVQHDAALAASLAAHGRATIEARHSCDHRARELLAIVAALQPRAAVA